MFSFLLGLVGAAVATNDRPIIGILTQPFGAEGSQVGNNSDHANKTYIAASYVKFVESAGARVVPVHFDAPDSDLREMFRQINGLIFPGGGTSLTNAPGNRFREAAKLLYGLALESNTQGDTFPIHGTCLGFQLLHLLVAENDDVLCRSCFDTEGTPLPLNFTHEAKTSQLFSAMSSPLFNALATQKLTENSHGDGILPKAYVENTKLDGFFKVLSTNEDGNGQPFVSTIEARHFPISATQWHPEKNNFEWGKVGRLGFEAIPHSVDAVLVSQYIANDFVGRARQSAHQFNSSEDEARALIYNYASVPDPQGYFAEVYLWGVTERTSTAQLSSQRGSIANVTRDLLAAGGNRRLRGVSDGPVPTA